MANNRKLLRLLVFLRFKSKSTAKSQERNTNNSPFLAFSIAFQDMIHVSYRNELQSSRKGKLTIARSTVYLAAVTKLGLGTGWLLIKLSLKARNEFNLRNSVCH